MPFDEIDSNNTEAYNTGKRSGKKRSRKAVSKRDYVKVGDKKGPVRKKKTASSKKSVIKM